MEKKKKSLFFKIMCGYVALWVVITVIVCLKLWSSLGEYQKNYDVAKAAVAPDLAAEKFLYLYDEAHLAETISNAGINIESEFADSEDLAKQLSRAYQGETLTFVKDSEYTDKKPVYDIAAGSKVIGELKLKADQSSDDYGFRQWVVKNASVNVDEIVFQDANIIVPKDSKIQINGKTVPETYLVSEKEDTLATEAEAISGISNQTQTYKVTGVLENPEITVTAKDGKEVALVEQNDFTYNYINCTNDAFIETVQELVKSVSEAYILNANNEISFGVLAQYLEPGSEAYGSIQSVQSGLAWAGKSDVINITESSTSDYVQYGEKAFTVKTYDKLYREYRGETYEDEFSYEWLFIKVGDSYKVRAFKLI